MEWTDDGGPDGSRQHVWEALREKFTKIEASSVKNEMGSDTSFTKMINDANVLPSGEFLLHHSGNQCTHCLVLTKRVSE